MFVFTLPSKLYHADNLRQDGKSGCKAEGKLQGCKCCPDQPPSCHIDKCEGDDKNICKATQYQGCACSNPQLEADVDYDPDDPPLDNKDAQNAAAQAVIKDVWGDDVKNIPGYSAPAAPAPSPTKIFCLHG
jgi:hypothetical protein